MQSELDQSKIEALKKRLYSPNADFSTDDNERRSLKSQEQIHTVVPEWEHATLEERHEEGPKSSKSGKWYKIFFFSSLAFCLGAAALAAVYLFSDKLFISSKNVDIVLTSAVSVAGGEAVPFSVSFINKNRVDLEDVEITLQYPDGSMDPENPTQEKLRDVRSIGTISRGASGQVAGSVILLGEEGERKQIVVTAAYSVGESGTRYEKKKEYEITVSQSPISLLIEYQKAISSGQETTFDIEVRSNMRSDLKDIVLKAEYPFGFAFSKSEPAALENGLIWNFPLLKAGEIKKIKITGIVQAQDNEDKVFKFSAGTKDPEDDRALLTTLTTKLAEVNILRPSVTIVTDTQSTLSNGQKTEISTLGSAISNNISFSNNLSRDILDPRIEVKIKGNLHDRSSIKPAAGFYQSSNDTVYWDRSTEQDLAVLSPGEQGSVSFSFDTLTLQEIGRNIRNPGLEYEITIKGKVVSEQGSSDNIEIKSVKQIRFATALGGLSQALYKTGPFTNTGPIPPKAEQKTRYTIEWQLNNTVNHVSNVEVTATLPIYVQFVPNQASSTNVTYNELTRTISWKAGEVSAYTGFESDYKRAYFQVEMLPSASQVGQIPVLVNAATVVGVDRFVEQEVRIGLVSVTTQAADIQANQAAILAP
ncbi:MAG TPA: hypothetical protein PLF31_02160 [Candidatus Paceibacterota bacterium]|nr:hypothetical protein [Candidatus Paceibacterota bacterium]